MKTLIFHIRQLLPIIFVGLFLAFAAFAQTGNPPVAGSETRSAVIGTYAQNTGPQQTANFNIFGRVSTNILDAKSLFKISGDRAARMALCCNYFAGPGAGTSNTTGSYNGIVGYKAGVSNTTGNNNAFFSTSAGYSNTSGSNNAFIGTNAGSGNTTGSENSFLGYQAGLKNTTGAANSFAGSNAGASNTTGGYNAFVGAYAGNANTTGQLNTFMGYKTGLSNTTGANNSFYGFDAGYGTTSGNLNSFFGTKAGFNTTTGSNNLFLGSDTGNVNITGNNNTLVGVSANTASGNLSFATAIGSGAVVSTNNTIVLGRSSGIDKVRVPGLSIGAIALCRNANNEISNCASSLRYKTNVAPFSSGLSLLQRLRPIRFEWKDGGMKDVGFGAEDIAALEPLLVTYNERGEVEGVKYDRLATVLVNAVKEQQAQIEAQQQQLKQQQAVIEGLKKLLCGKTPDAEVCKQ